MSRINFKKELNETERAKLADCAETLRKCVGAIESKYGELMEEWDNFICSIAQDVQGATESAADIVPELRGRFELLWDMTDDGETSLPYASDYSQGVGNAAWGVEDLLEDGETWTIEHDEI